MNQKRVWAGAWCPWEKKKKEPSLKPYTKINVNNFVTSEVSETRQKKL